MAAYEILLLNTAIPQIQAAQSGDTYVVPRDIAFSAALTLSAGTANGVPYLNASKVLTTGSALTFDGATVGVFNGTTVSYRFNANRGTDDTAQGLRFGYAGIDAYRTGATLSQSITEIAFTQTGSNGTRTSFKIDTDGNSIWSPGPGAGIEAMRLTSTGLGIGANNPAYKLHVVNDTAATNTAVDVLALTQSSTGTADSGLGAGILFNSERPTGGVIIKRGAIYGVAGTDPDDDGALTFYTLSDTGPSGFTEKMRLDASGNLGLGVTPSAWWSGMKALQVGSGAALYDFGSSNVALGSNLYFDGTNSRYINTDFASYYQQNNGIHIWATAPSGTANSASVADTNSYTVVALGATTLGEWQTLFSGLGSLPSLGQVITATATGSIPNGGLVTQNISFTQAMTLDANGNLGVGETNPAQTLHVKTSTSATPITLGVLSNATSLPALSFNGAYASTTMAGIYGNGATASNLYYTVPASQSHFFAIADATKMTLDASGNLGIGTTNPSAYGKLAVDGNISLVSYTQTMFANKFQIVSSSGDMEFLGGSSNILFKTGVSNTERARITSDGNLLVGETSSNSGNNGLKVKGQFALTTAQTFTASGSVNDSAYYIVCYALSATCTLTLPTPANNTGRLLNIVVQSAQQVVSASSNVTAIADGSVGTAILPATAGKWAQLWCDGAYWNIIATNV